MDFHAIKHRPHPRQVGGRAVVGRLGDQVAPKPFGVTMENLLGDVAFEYVGEILGRCAMDRAEVLRVDQVVDQLARIGLNDQLVHVPGAQPFVAVPFGQMRYHHIGTWRLAFRVVPHEQQAVLFAGQPTAGLGFWRNPLAVGDFHTFAAAVVLPVVERADHAIILNGALRQIRAHMRAVGIEYADLAGGRGKRQQACAKDIQGVQLAVTIIIRLTQAVPTTAEARSQNIFDIDFCELGHSYCSSR
ncbi:hypothetical protein D3C85_677830 [compost metagenome]